MEAGRLVSEGSQKVLGVTTTTVQDWKQRYLLNKKSKEPSFNEVAVTDDNTKFKIKLSATVQGCRVGLTGSDYALLQCTRFESCKKMSYGKFSRQLWRKSRSR